jgi:60 kDa SS-A/Ro ribonucleoprotein
MTKNQYAQYATNHNPSSTPQTSPIPGREAEMAQNNAGGYTFTASPFTQLDRFLILGTDGPTYYQSAKALTEDNAKAIINLIKSDGVRVVERIREVSLAGRAPKNDPAIFALTLAMTHGDAATKTAAYEALPDVARIGTHLLHAADYVNSLRGWGRGIRRAFGNWYLSKAPKSLAMQLVKYANRDGWSHRDVLRLAHPSADGVHNALLSYAAGKGYTPSGMEDVDTFMDAVAQIKRATSALEVAQLISTHQLPREVVPTEFLSDGKVWEALLPHMGLTALVRNLATMTRLGVLGVRSSPEALVLGRLTSADELRKSRVHPIQMVSAFLTYRRGYGVRSDKVWTPNTRIVSALEDGFYASFGNVVPSGKRYLLGVDVSGSMGMGEIASVPGLSPAIASAVMSMVTVRSEPDVVINGFTDRFVDLGIQKNDTLDAVQRKTQLRNFGSTNCSMPMEYASQEGIAVDTFVVYTDNETYAGRIAPSQALQQYRNKTGIPARLVVVGMTSTGFTIADPKDAGMLDVVGFDTATPQIISDFAMEKF